MSKRLKWLLIILHVLIVLLISFLAWQYFATKPSKKSASTPTTTPVATTKDTDTSTTTKENTSDNTTTTTEEKASVDGWKIFKNSHGYLIEYPEDATVENGSASEDEKDKPATDAYCVKISTQYYWVIIAARGIPDNIFCLKTGLGTEWQNAPDEEVTAAGQNYTAKGMVFQSASMGTYADDYTITTLSGEKIGYGIGVNNNDNAMTKVQAKALVHKILGTFSPAE